MKYKKILFATDFSSASEAALKYATALARDSGAKLIILHVEELPMPYAGGEMYFPETEFPNPELQTILSAVVPSDKNVAYEHKLVLGVPAQDIVQTAIEEQVDLIVLGTHGRTGIKRVLMGSVAESVIRHATCPVLTLKEANQAPPETQ